MIFIIIIFKEIFRNGLSFKPIFFFLLLFTVTQSHLFCCKYVQSKFKKKHRTTTLESIKHSAPPLFTLCGIDVLTTEHQRFYHDGEHFYNHLLEDWMRTILVFYFEKQCIDVLGFFS